MHQYHGSMPVGAATPASDTTTQSTPIAREKSCPTRFKAGRSVRHEPMPVVHGSSVDIEFRKYTSGEVSAKTTDILWFWEVRFFQLNGTMTESLHRPIRTSFRYCSRWLWTTCQSRQRRYPAREFSPQRRRRTPANETGQAQYLWRRFNYINFLSRKNASASRVDGQHRKPPCLGCPGQLMTLGLSLCLVLIMLIMLWTIS